MILKVVSQILPEFSASIAGPDSWELVMTQPTPGARLTGTDLALAAGET